MYCNGRRDRDAFNAKVDFDVDLLPYNGNDNWVENTIIELKKLTDRNKTKIGT